MDCRPREEAQPLTGFEGVGSNPHPLFCTLDSSRKAIRYPHTLDISSMCIRLFRYSRTVPPVGSRFRTQSASLQRDDPSIFDSPIQSSKPLANKSLKEKSWGRLL